MSLGAMIDAYDSLLDVMDSEDAEEVMLSDRMSIENIEKNLADPNIELTDIYTDDEIDAIFSMVRSGAVKDAVSEKCKDDDNYAMLLELKSLGYDVEVN